jgi:uncharacterized membrane protein
VSGSTSRIFDLLPAPRAGRILFGLAVLASGILQLVTDRFVRLVPKSPVHALSPVWCGLLLVLIGVALVLRIFVPFAALALAAILLVLFLGLYLPVLIKDPWSGFEWTNPLKTLQLLGGAILIAGPRAGRFVRWLPPLLLGVFLAVCGMQHFVYANFVATLIPSWIPAHMFWTYVAGVALIAGGVGIMIPKTLHWAATMSGIMVLLWVLLLHIPRAIGMQSSAETAAIFEALATSGVAFMVAGTRSGQSTSKKT